MFHCFGSKARINGEVVSIGVEESRKLKSESVCRGFCSASGDEAETLPWKAKLVMMLRAATTADDFNHEWWGARTLLPAWVSKLDEVTGRGWLHFPADPEEMTASSIGQRLGFELALGERQLHSAVNDQEFLKRWEAAEFEKAIRGSEDLAPKTRVVLTGFNSWTQFAAESYHNAREFRAVVIAFVAQEAEPLEFTDFTQGFGAGAKRASAVDLWNKLSEFNEREEVAEILRDHAEHLDTLPNRAEITKVVRSYLPAARRAFLNDPWQWRSFTDRMRAIYEQIGLKKARRGRPPKNRENDGT